MERKIVANSFAKSSHGSARSYGKRQNYAEPNKVAPKDDIFSNCDADIVLDDEPKPISSVFSLVDSPKLDANKNLSKSKAKNKLVCYKNDFEIDILLRVSLMQKQLGNKYQRYVSIIICSPELIPISITVTKEYFRNGSLAILLSRIMLISCDRYSVKANFCNTIN